MLVDWERQRDIVSDLQGAAVASGSVFVAGLLWQMLSGAHLDLFEFSVWIASRTRARAPGFKLSELESQSPN